MTRVTFFAFDIAEAAQIRRIRSVRSLGHDVASVSFRRANMNARFEPDWPDLSIGQTQNNSFRKRLLQLGSAVARIHRDRHVLDGSNIWIARNFDLLAVAWATRALTGRRDVRLVYECLDIHGSFTRRDILGGLMRWFERRLLSRISLLILSSPGFLRAYFDPVQGYVGEVALIENKLWMIGQSNPRPAHAREPDADGPLVLGWVGSLRCAESLALLAAVAEALGSRIRIVFHGNVHRHAVPDFDAVVAGHSNITYSGAYDYPQDLGAIYRSCDLVWSQDLWQKGANSDWLLPNRIYEASFYGCPSIAIAGTETGRRVADDGLGFVLSEPSAEQLSALLTSLLPQDIAVASQRLLDKPESAFRLQPDELEGLLSSVLSPPGTMVADRSG